MGKKLKALITSTFNETYLKKLNEIIEVEYRNWVDIKRPYSEKEIIKMGKDKDILIVDLEKINNVVINNLKIVKLIGCTRGNPVDIDLKILQEKGIPLITTPGRNATTVAELTVAFIIMGLRHINESNMYINEKRWLIESELTPYLVFKSKSFEEAVVGIIGFGSVGKELARMLEAFNFRILVYDPYIKEDFKGKSLNIVDMDYLLKESDVITIHCSLNEETKNLIKYDDFLNMKNSAVFINTARAGIVNQLDFKKALRERLIREAYLDVFENEPLDCNDELYSMKNVYMTPHIGGASEKVDELHSRMIYEDILNYINHRKLKHEFQIKD